MEQDPRRGGADLRLPGTLTEHLCQHMPGWTLEQLRGGSGSCSVRRGLGSPGSSSDRGSPQRFRAEGVAWLECDSNVQAREYRATETQPKILRSPGTGRSQEGTGQQGHYCPQVAPS